MIFAYTPVEDPAVYKTAWSDFLDHLKAETGKDVVFFPVQNNAAQIEAMRSGRLHIAGFNTGSNPLAVNCAGFRPFTIMASKDGNFGYEMEIITYPGSGIEKVEDIKGKQLAFTSPTSNSGFKAPSAILKSDFDLLPERDFEPVYSGKHDNSILGCRQQGLSGRLDRQLGQVADDLARCDQRRRRHHDLQIADFPDDRLWHRVQPDARAAGENPQCLLQLRLGRERRLKPSSRNRTKASFLR